MHTLCLLLLLPLTFSAHLPAIRQPKLQDSKRVLASRLIRSADRHKERSLRDVLVDNNNSPPSETRSQARDQARKSQQRQEQQQEQQKNPPIRTMSDLFAWAINNTVHGVNVSAAASVQRDDPPRGQPVTVNGRQALPDGTAAAAATAATTTRKAATSAISVDEMQLGTDAESEFDILKRNVNMLDKQQASPQKVAKALRVLEELCHSIDNGRDLQISGGISPLLKALSSEYDAVRANAAWALATCCQNNPTVQQAALELQAVPLLSALAADDGSSNVRSKALFALNAMLELEQARTEFEELPKAIDVLRKALVDSSDFRATRRALNLTELLLQRNLDAWRGTLEAWDIPMLVEMLMRSHPDIDVRTSAARAIAALDGRPVA